jgi:hypothetical protein
MKLGSRKVNKKTETMTVKLHGEIKELIELMAEETDQKTITAVIEGVASAYKNKAYCPGEWTKVKGKNIYVRKEEA